MTKEISQHKRHISMLTLDQIKALKQAKEIAMQKATKDKDQVMDPIVPFPFGFA